MQFSSRTNLSELDSVKSTGVKINNLKKHEGRSTILSTGTSVLYFKVTEFNDRQLNNKSFYS